MNLNINHHVSIDHIFPDIKNDYNQNLLRDFQKNLENSITSQCEDSILKHIRQYQDIYLRESLFFVKTQWQHWTVSNAYLINDTLYDFIENKEVNRQLLQKLRKCTLCRYIGHEVEFCQHTCLFCQNIAPEKLNSVYASFFQIYQLDLKKLIDIRNQYGGKVSFIDLKALIYFFHHDRSLSLQQLLKFCIGDTRFNYNSSTQMIYLGELIDMEELLTFTCYPYDQGGFAIIFPELDQLLKDQKYQPYYNILNKFIQNIKNKNIYTIKATSSRRELASNFITKSKPIFVNPDFNQYIIEFDDDKNHKLNDPSLSIFPLSCLQYKNGLPNHNHIIMYKLLKKGTTEILTKHQIKTNDLYMILIPPKKPIINIENEKSHIISDQKISKYIKFNVYLNKWRQIDLDLRYISLEELYLNENFINLLNVLKIDFYLKNNIEFSSYEYLPIKYVNTSPVFLKGRCKFYLSFEYHDPILLISIILSCNNQMISNHEDTKLLNNNKILSIDLNDLDIGDYQLDIIVKKEKEVIYQQKFSFSIGTVNQYDTSIEKAYFTYKDDNFDENKKIDLQEEKNILLEDLLISNQLEDLFKNSSLLGPIGHPIHFYLDLAYPSYHNRKNLQSSLFSHQIYKKYQINQSKTFLLSQIFTDFKSELSKQSFLIIRIDLKNLGSITIFQNTKYSWINMQENLIQFYKTYNHTNVSIQHQSNSHLITLDLFKHYGYHLVNLNTLKLFNTHQFEYINQRDILIAKEPFTYYDHKKTYLGQKDAMIVFCLEVNENEWSYLLKEIQIIYKDLRRSLDTLDRNLNICIVRKDSKYFTIIRQEIILTEIPFNFIYWQDVSQIQSIFSLANQFILKNMSN